MIVSLEPPRRILVGPRVEFADGSVARAHALPTRPDDPADVLGPYREHTTRDGWPYFVGATRALFVFLDHACVVEGTEGLEDARLHPGDRACCLSELLDLAQAEPLPACAPPPLETSGWIAVRRADGVELRHESGDAQVRLRELGEDLPRTLVLEEVLRTRALLGVPAATVRRMTTATDHALVAVVRGEGVATTRAWVFSEHACAEVAAVAAPHLEALVDAIVLNLVDRWSSGAGDRLRRFLYTPPAGWLGVARGLHADWVSPDGGRLLVMPACPTERRQLAEIDLLLRGAPPAGRPPVVHDLLTSDGRFLYPVRLETTPAREREHLRVAEAVVASRVPLRVGPVRQDSALFDIWR